MDLLSQRYASPFLVLDDFIRLHQLHDFVVEIFNKISKEKIEEKNIIVSISDTGCGMDDKTIKRIFDKFYQADGSHKAEGNGLGLALVKRIIDSAGGTIEAQNREYGGCRFVVQLPLQ